MPLKNYSTSVPAEKTVAEIISILSKHGAREILMEYDDAGNVEGVRFRVDTPHGKLPFTLPLKLEAVHRTLNHHWGKGKGVSRAQTTMEHARKVGWRNLKDWLDAQMALLETDMVEFEQVFLPYMAVNKDQNLYQYMLTTGFHLALPEPTDGESP